MDTATADCEAKTQINREGKIRYSHVSGNEETRGGLHRERRCNVADIDYQYHRLIIYQTRDH